MSPTCEAPAAQTAPMAVTVRCVLLTSVFSALQHHVERHYVKGATR